MMSQPETELSSIMLSLPGIGTGETREAHARFAAVVELVGRYLVLFRGDQSFGLVHFHPAIWVPFLLNSCILVQVGALSSCI